MNRDHLKNRLPMLMLVFAFGGIFGFIYEEIFYRFDLGEWVKRGTTFGPWIPIYGFGGILILGLTYKIRKNPFPVFLLASIASGILEFATGWVFLEFFGMRLWDYNEEILNWGNIGGFVCVRSVLFFGISGIFLRFLVMPIFEKLEKKMPKKAWLALCYIPAGLFITDIIVSIIFKAAGWH
jgi:uncharacterized membrane protein